MAKPAEEDLIAVSCDVALPYRYAAGSYGARFLEGLRNGRIIGSKCGACGLVLVPPRIVCSRCYRKMEGFVDLPPTGTLTSYTQVTFPFIDPLTGHTRPVPYCYGMIRFDGADNTFQYFLEESDIRKIRLGMRVSAVFRRKRDGSMRDIQFFRTESRARGPKGNRGRKKR